MKGRHLGSARHRFRVASGVLLAALVVTTAACDDPPAPPPPEPTAPVAPAAKGPAIDARPPVVRGPLSATLLGTGTWRIAWAGLSDDTSGEKDLAIHILPVARDGTVGETPLAELPGRERAWIAERVEPGTGFLVQVVDRAGNVSVPHPILWAPDERSWLSAYLGTPLTRLVSCRQTPGVPLVCLGEDGSLQAWHDGGWRLLPHRAGSGLRFTDTPGVIRFSDADGNLHALAESLIDPEGERIVGDAVELRRTRYPDGAPALPLRSVVRDQHDLTWVVDAKGAVHVGTGHLLRRMTRPLALPGDTTCGTLTGLAFDGTSGIALCDDGSVHSISGGDPGMRWLPLTSSTPPGIGQVRRLLSEEGGRGTVLTSSGLWRVEVGGWTSLWVATTDPSGRPETLIDLQQAGPGRPVVLTSRRVLAHGPGGWGPVPGSEGEVVGVMPPAWNQPKDAMQVVFADSTVALVHRGTRSWVAPPRPDTFATTGLRTDGALIVATNDRVLAADSGGWVEVAASLPTSPTGSALIPERMSASAEGRVTMVGALGEGGAILVEGERGWASAELAFAPVPRPNDPPPDPLAPLVGVPAARAGANVVAMEPLFDLDQGPDRRAIAVGERQVWWRLPDGRWRYLTSVESPIGAVALDAGDGWLVQQGDGFRRCWQDRCDGVAQPAAIEGGVRSTWRSSQGFLALDRAGGLHRWMPAASAAPDRAGSWERVAEPLDPALAARAHQRLRSGEIDVVLTDEGALLERVADVWREQLRADDGLLLMPFREGWALLTTRGLLRPSEGIVSEVSTEP